MRSGLAGVPPAPEAGAVGDMCFTPQVSPRCKPVYALIRLLQILPRPRRAPDVGQRQEFVADPTVMLVRAPGRGRLLELERGAARFQQRIPDGGRGRRADDGL